MGYNYDKTYRLLRMNEQLSRGEPLRKEALVSAFDITPKTAQRDIESLRLYLGETGEGDLIYDRKHDCYKLQSLSKDNLTAEEVFSLCKILIESRAFNKEEFETLVRKLLLKLSPAQRLPVEARINNERINYLQVTHGKFLIDTLWQLANLITEQKLARIWYIRQDKTAREHIIKPVGIMFSDFYFYLIAWIADNSKTDYTVFRVDRITDIESKNERFDIPYSSRFNEAEFRKRVQFMYPGKLRTIRFRFKGPSLEAILDRLPTAKIESEDSSGVIVRAEVYGNGADMWLKSQGEWVEYI